MKKILSIALALVMMLSCAVTLILNVSANGTDALEAPVPEFTQCSTVTDNNTQNIRFLAGVKNLNGTRLGYEIVAEFMYQNSYRKIEYGGEDYETTNVFNYVYANGESYSTTDIYGENTEYKYWHVMTISNIPTNIGDIYFRVKSYVIDSDGNKTYSDELCAQYIDGKLDETVNIQNFNNISGSINVSGFDTSASGSDIKIDGQSTGWNLTTSQNWQSGYNDIIAFEDGTARIHTNGDFIRLIDESVFSGMYKYSIDADVRVDEAGVINFVFNNSSTALPTANSLRVRLGRYYEGGKISGGGTFAKDGTLGIQLLASTLYTNIDGTTLPVEVEEQTKNIGDNFHLTIDVNNTTRIASVFVDGALITSISFGEEFVNNGGLYTYIQGGDITIDNLRVYGEEYDSNEKGELLYKQDFNNFSGTYGGTIANNGGAFAGISNGANIVLGNQATGWALNKQNDWGSYDKEFVSFENGEARLQMDGDYVRLIDESVFAGTYKYTIDADLKINEAGIIYFLFNNGGKASCDAGLRLRFGGTNDGNNASGGSEIYTENSADKNKAMKFEIREASTWKAGGTVGKNIGDQFHLTIDVNNATRKISVFINGAVIKTYMFSESFDVAGGLYTNIEGGDITIDNLTVYGEKYLTGEAGDVLYSQNFDSLSASTDTDAVLKALGITVPYEYSWSNPGKYAEITSDGRLKLNGGGTAYEIISAKELHATTSFTLQFDLEVTSLGNMELLLTKTNENYDSSKGPNSATGNSVMFRNYNSADETSGFANGTTNLGYLTQSLTDGSKTNIGVQQTHIGGSSAYGQTYKVIVEMVAGTSLSVSIYDANENQVGTTRTVTTADGTICDDVNGISIRLQNAPITIDNVIFSVGTYSDYCL